MKAIVVVDQQGVPKSVFLTYYISEEEQKELKDECGRHHLTFHYMDIGWEGDPVPFHMLIDKIA